MSNPATNERAMPRSANSDQERTTEAGSTTSLTRRTSGPAGMMGGCSISIAVPTISGFLRADRRHRRGWFRRPRARGRLSRSGPVAPRSVKAQPRFQRRMESEMARRTSQTRTMVPAARPAAKVRSLDRPSIATAASGSRKTRPRRAGLPVSGRSSPAAAPRRFHRHTPALRRSRRG